MSVDAFWNDELYTYTNPRREQYPDHFRNLFLHRHKTRHWSPGFVFHLAVTDDRDVTDPEERVVGYAIWERRGTSEEAKKLQKQTYRCALELTLLNATETYNSLIRADKSLDHERLRHFRSEAADGFVGISEMWKLHNLCVHVDYQRRGIGSMLIEWGKEQAEKEKVPIGLESSTAARSTYLKNGCREFGRLHIKDFPIDVVPICIGGPYTFPHIN